ncbi:hypothetical protein DAVIS_03225 [Mycobacterium marinum]|uniref:Uncharacterized protein n=1 Tax=Mycobacterium marinum TaxID=1781 RepID=A0A3E2MU81_MYCMR|nr:hypothetical protein DAVIS_03225 [Mycobacterium marinum]
MVDGHEKIELFGGHLKERELEQRAVPRHRLSMHRQPAPIGFRDGISTASQVVEWNLEIRVVDHLLNDMPVILHDGGP